MSQIGNLRRHHGALALIEMPALQVQRHHEGDEIVTTVSFASRLDAGDMGTRGDSDKAARAVKDRQTDILVECRADADIAAGLQGAVGQRCQTVCQDRIATKAPAPTTPIETWLAATVIVALSSLAVTPTLPLPVAVPPRCQPGASLSPSR